LTRTFLLAHSQVSGARAARFAGFAGHTHGGVGYVDPLTRDEPIEPAPCSTIMRPAARPTQKLPRKMHVDRTLPGPSMSTSSAGWTGSAMRHC